MRPLKALLLLQAISGSLVVASEVPQHDDSTPQIGKRWYSVPVGQEVPPHASRAWPACRDGTSTIPYCFEDEDAHRDLEDLFSKALAKWAGAMYESSLAFAPDVACIGHQGRCLCSTNGVAETTLRIMLSEDDNAEASLGYLPPPEPKRSPDKPRHYIQWPKNPDLFGADAARNMAHEIGETFEPIERYLLGMC